MNLYRIQITLPDGTHSEHSERYPSSMVAILALLQVFGHARRISVEQVTLPLELEGL
jgi:hypothetical protein